MATCDSHVMVAMVAIMHGCHGNCRLVNRRYVPLQVGEVGVQGDPDPKLEGGGASSRQR